MDNYFSNRITIEQIKQLREETGVSPIEIKKALEQSKGDIEKAKEILRTWGKSLAGKKIRRETKQGIIDTYIHPNSKIGVLLDIKCESDFVAKSPDFKNLAHEICLQIVAMKPLFVKDSDLVRISKLPDKKVLYTMIASSLNAPIIKLARILNSVPQKFVSVVDALREKKEGEAA